MDAKLYEILGSAGRLVMAGICFGTFPVLSGGTVPNFFRGRHGQRLGKPFVVIQPGNEEFPTEDPLEPSGHGTEAV